MKKKFSDFFRIFPFCQIFSKIINKIQSTFHQTSFHLAHQTRQRFRKCEISIVFLLCPTLESQKVTLTATTSAQSRLCQSKREKPRRRMSCRRRSVTKSRLSTFLHLFRVAPLPRSGAESIRTRNLIREAMFEAKHCTAPTSGGGSIRATTSATFATKAATSGGIASTVNRYGGGVDSPEQPATSPD